MSSPSVWSVAFKVTLYLFDLLSDWVNGILMLTTNGCQDYKADNSTFGYGQVGCEENTKDAKRFGAWTIALSYVPAIFGLLASAYGSRSWSKCSMWKLLLIPIQFILWPLLVALLMSVFIFNP